MSNSTKRKCNISFYTIERAERGLPPVAAHAPPPLRYYGPWPLLAVAISISMWAGLLWLAYRMLRGVFA